MVSPTRDAPDTLEVPDGSVLEHLVLARFQRVTTWLADPRVREVPAWHRLAQHAVAAAYWDCEALALKDQAAVIIEEAFADRA